MRSQRDLLAECVGFDWDEENLDKNWDKHRVAFWEIEEALMGRPLVVAADAAHSKHEARYYALGRTDGGRHLFIAFTIRRDLIRAISAREMTRRERKSYENQTKNDPEVF